MPLTVNPARTLAVAPNSEVSLAASVAVAVSLSPTTTPPTVSEPAEVPGRIGGEEPKIGLALSRGVRLEDLDTRTGEGCGGCGGRSFRLTGHRRRRSRETDEREHRLVHADVRLCDIRRAVVRGDAIEVEVDPEAGVLEDRVAENPVLLGGSRESTPIPICPRDVARAGSGAAHGVAIDARLELDAVGAVAEPRGDGARRIGADILPWTTLPADRRH